MFYKLQPIDDFEDDPLPERGELSFRFDSLRKPPSSKAKMEDAMSAPKPLYIIKMIWWTGLAPWDFE